MTTLDVNYISKTPKELTKKTLIALTNEAKKAVFTQSYIVGPEIAEYILDNLNPKNRTINKGHVDSLVRDMQNGSWMGHVADEIIFDNEGHLNNGQHRLTAIIKSELPQTFAFRFGLDPKCRLVEGRGRTKQSSDTLSMLEGSDTPHRTSRAAIARLIYGFIHDQVRPQVYSGNAKPTNSEMMDMIYDHFNQDILDSLNFVNSIGIGKITIVTNAAFLHFLFKNSTNGKKADEFFTKLASGANLDVDNPILVIKNRFTDFRKDKLREQKSKDASLGLIVKAWNAWNNNEKWSTRVQYPNEMLKIEGLKKIGKYKLYD
jgi:hypothetical protein